MPESKRRAINRAKKEGFKKSNVVKSDKDGYFISPKGIEKTSSKKAYANCRQSGNAKEKCAKISWSLEKRGNKK